MGGKSARFSTSIERRRIFLRNILTNVKQNPRTWRPVLLGMLGSNLRMITTLSGQGPANSESKHTNQGPPAELPSLTKHPPENLNFSVEWQAAYIMRKMTSPEKWQIEALWQSYNIRKSAKNRPRSGYHLNLACCWTNGAVPLARFHGAGEKSAGDNKGLRSPRTCSNVRPPGQNLTLIV